MQRGLTAKPFWQTVLSEDKCLTLLLETRTKDDFQLSHITKKYAFGIQSVSHTNWGLQPLSTEMIHHICACSCSPAPSDEQLNLRVCQRDKAIIRAICGAC